MSSPAITEDHYVDHACRMAGLAGRILHWRPDDFWSATPGELNQFLGAHSGGWFPLAGDSGQQYECGIHPDQIKQLVKEFPDG